MGKKSRSHQKKPKSEAGAQLGNISSDLVTFYRSILVPGQLTEEEFNLMLQFYKKPLPTVFRLSHVVSDRPRLESELHRLLEDLSDHSSDFTSYTCFPSEFGLVYKASPDRSQIRKSPAYEKFNTWLRMNTDAGNCHRQEFVSMLPPLFMDVKEDSSVLDMCAAPGSKTTQIMEMLRSGYVVANDSNTRRCHDLVHQLQRVGTQNAIVTCQNGSKFEVGFDQFDRVLCDVPCTGDGTMRKNPESGAKWSVEDALKLHDVQKNILLRGLELLKKDGVCVYSTCSMNPIEDEAVVSEVISELGTEKVEMVDCTQKFPAIKRHKGILKWDAALQNVPQEKNIHGEAKCPNIDFCMRFYPQDHDSGGFFIAVIKKISDFERKTEPKPAKELKEAAFHSLEKVSKKHLDEIFQTYGLENCKPSQFFVRDETKVNKVYYMCDQIAELISKYGSEALHTVSAGVAVFNFKSYSKKSPEVPYVSQEGIRVAFKLATKRKYALTPKEMLMLFKAGAEGLHISKFEEERQAIFANKPRNCAIFYIEGTQFMYMGHLAKFSLILYLKKDLIQNELRKLISYFPELSEENTEDKK